MLKALRAVATTGVLALSVAPAVTGAERPVFFTLPPEAIPSDVSANGYVVVGSLYSGGAFYWTPVTGVVPIGGRAAVAVSRDGRTIVGNALDARGIEHAAVWEGGQRWRLLGSFTPAAAPCDALLSAAYGVSADARVIVGLGWDGCRLARAFRWEEATGMANLGSSVSGRSSRANAVSGDGRVVVGWQDDSFGFRQGAVWRNGRQQLFVGPFGAVGEAQAANSDGSLVVGQNCDPATLSAWQWTQATGVVCAERVERRGPPGQSFISMMLATSDDGRVVGGAHSFGLDSESVIWLDGRAAFLKDYLRDSGLSDAFRGWVNTGFVTAVSPDGRVLAGYGAGPTAFQGFVVILPAGAETGRLPAGAAR